MSILINAIHILSFAWLRFSGAMDHPRLSTTGGTHTVPVGTRLEVGSAVVASRALLAAAIRMAAGGAESASTIGTSPGKTRTPAPEQSQCTRPRLWSATAAMGAKEVPVPAVVRALDLPHPAVAAAVVAALAEAEADEPAAAASMYCLVGSINWCCYLFPLMYKLLCVVWCGAALNKI